jgi:hypothetical protein
MQVDVALVDVVQIEHLPVDLPRLLKQKSVLLVLEPVVCTIQLWFVREAERLAFGFKGCTLPSSRLSTLNRWLTIL